MPRLILSLLVFLAVPLASAQTDLILTGAIDGPLTGGLPKAVEVYVVNNVADLSIYGIGSANNGGGSDGEEFTFPAVPATAGDFLYVATESPQFTSWFGFAPDYTSSAVSINGDDAIELFMNGAVVDVFGDIDVSGTGEPWEYMDGWAYRNEATGPDGTTFVLDNWSFSGPDALDGESTNATADTPFPTGTYSPEMATVEECTTGSPLYISDFMMGAPGSVTVTNSDEAGGDTVELSGCTLAVYDGYDEVVEDTETAPDPTPLAPMTSYVYTPTIEAHRPGAVVLSTEPLENGDDVEDALNTIVAAVVFDADGDVFGECGNGPDGAGAGGGDLDPCSSPEGQQNMLRAFTALFGGATAGEGDGAVALGVSVGPNPVRGSARVTYGVPGPSAVRVSVFDALGREVAVLAEGPRGPGAYQAALDGAALPAGVYVVRAAVGSEVRTASVTVVR